MDVRRGDFAASSPSLAQCGEAIGHFPGWRRGKPRYDDVPVRGGEFVRPGISRARHGGSGKVKGQPGAAPGCSYQWHTSICSSHASDETTYMVQISRRMFALGIHTACGLRCPWRTVLCAVRRVFSILASERRDRRDRRNRRASYLRRHRLGPRGAVPALCLHRDRYRCRGARLAVWNGAALI